MSETSARSTSAYVLGHADAELQRLAEQAAFYGELTEDAFRRARLPAPTMIGAGRVEGGADSHVFRYMAATMRSLPFVAAWARARQRERRAAAARPHRAMDYDRAELSPRVTSSSSS